MDDIRLIDLLGGAQKLADALTASGWPIRADAIYMWRSRGVIPSQHRPWIADIARTAGVAFDESLFLRAQPGFLLSAKRNGESAVSIPISEGVSDVDHAPDHAPLEGS